MLLDGGYNFNLYYNPLAPITLNTLSPLAVGSAGLNSNYIPTGGWVDGSYDFTLQLNINGKPYTSSTVANLKVSGSGNNGSKESGGRGMNLYLLGGIIAAVVVMAGILVFWFRRKK